MKIRLLGTEFFNVEGQNNGETDVTNFMIVFRNFAKELKK